MAFSDYKNIADVQKQFTIKYREENFIIAQEIELSEQFTEDFKFYRENIDIYTSEASRCEIIISPILKELYKKYVGYYSFWIHKSITFDEVLTGTPDYIYSHKSALGKTVLESPLLVVVEAKKNDFEQGWGQCLAELVAMQKINKDAKRTVYGIVTDGDLWQFGKLREDIFTRNSKNYTIDNLSSLFGALDYVLQESIIV